MSFVDKDDWAPGKRLFYDRITQEKRQKEFRELREKLRVAPGLPPTDAWRVAGSQYPPLDGSPMEYPPTEDVLEWIRRLGINNPWEEVVVAAVKMGDDLVEETRAKDAKRETPSQKILKAAATMEAMVALVGTERVANELDCARWAFDNMLVPWSKIDADLVPSIGALGLLDFAKKNSAEFLRTIWVKLLPDRKGVEAAGKFLDDGREILADLDALDKEFWGEGESDAA